MKRKGFTLIELLAVIVVLAIIALIATPIVMNVIKKANEGAAERSADNYLKAVDTLIATEKLDGTPLADGEYTIGTDGKITLGANTYEVEVSGTKPMGGTVKIENGQVVKTSSTVSYADYNVTYSEGKAEASEKGEALVLCSLTSGNNYDIGAQYTCDLGDGEREFYVLRVDGNNVKLIMNENLDDFVPWANERDNSAGPTVANQKLKDSTTNWTNLTKASGKVELPSASDLALAMGDTEWSENNVTGTVGPEWMRLNTGVSGYWTSTPYGEEEAFLIHPDGFLFSFRVNSENPGIRPVILISKDNMSL